MVGYLLDETGPGIFPRPGGVVTDRMSATEEDGRKMKVHLGRSGEIQGGFLANRNIHSAKAEYGYAVYCNATNYGYVLGGGEKSRGQGRGYSGGNRQDLTWRG